MAETVKDDKQNVDSAKADAPVKVADKNNQPEIKSEKKKVFLFTENVIHKGAIYKKGEEVPDKISEAEIADLKKKKLVE